MLIWLRIENVWLQKCKQGDMADVCLAELINDWITQRITRVKGKSLQNALLIAATSWFPKLPRLVNLIHFQTGGPLRNPKNLNCCRINISFDRLIRTMLGDAESPPSKLHTMTGIEVALLGQEDVHVRIACLDRAHSEESYFESILAEDE